MAVWLSMREKYRKTISVSDFYGRWNYVLNNSKLYNFIFKWPYTWHVFFDKFMITDHWWTCELILHRILMISTMAVDSIFQFMFYINLLNSCSIYRKCLFAKVFARILIRGRQENNYSKGNKNQMNYWLRNHSW